MAQVEALTAQKVPTDQWKRFVEAYTNPGTDSKNSNTIAERRAGELHYLWNADERVAPWAGTAYGVLAAVNTHAHHIATVRNARRSERNMERVVKGGVDTMDANTLALLASV